MGSIIIKMHQYESKDMNGIYLTLNLSNTMMALTHNYRVLSEKVFMYMNISFLTKKDTNEAIQFKNTGVLGLHEFH